MKKLFKKIKDTPVALKASIAYVICSIIQKSLSFITMPLFTSILTKSEYGQYTIYVSWSSIFTILITLNLAFGSFGNAMMKYENKRSEYVSSIQGLVFLFALLFICIYLPFSSFFNSFIELPTSLIILMVFEILLQFGQQCWLGIQRYRYKYISVVIVTLLMSVLSPTLAFILVKNSNDKGIARVLGNVIVSIVFGGCIFIYNIFKGKKIYSKEYWVYALKFNLPLLVYYFSQVIFNESDRIMIQKLCDDGLGDAAVYGVGYSIALILTFILNSINNAYVPWLYNSLKNNDISKNKKMTLLITIIMCTLVGGVIWIAPEVVKIMAGIEYLEAVNVIPPVAISLILLLFSQYCINVEFYYAEKWKLVLASVGAAIFNVILNLWLIPLYGFVAAAYTTMISYIVFALCNYFAIWKYINKKGELYKLYNWKILLIIFVAFVALAYLGVLLYEYPVVRYTSILIVIFVLLLFSKRIYVFLKPQKIDDNSEGKNNEEEIETND